MLCLGRSIGVLVAGRLLQGGSAAVVWTVALALLADTVGEAESGKAMGYVAMSYSLGVLVAPLLGGIVYERSGYYAVFAMTFGVIGLDIILRLLLVEQKVAATWLQPSITSPDDFQTPSDLPLQPVKDKTVSSTEATSTSNGAAASKAKRKLPPMLILLKSRRILAAFWGNLVGATTTAALDTTLPLFVNRTFGWNSLGAGLLFLALILPSGAGPIIGMTMARHIDTCRVCGGIFSC